jgi:hypothetical protein
MFSLIAPKELTLFTISMLVFSGLVGIVAQPHHMAVAGSGKTEMNCRVGWTYGNFIKRLCTIGWALAGLFAAALVVTGALPKADLDAKRELAFGAMVKTAAARRVDRTDDRGDHRDRDCVLRLIYDRRIGPLHPQPLPALYASGW